jgi:hypothetical protein
VLGAAATRNIKPCGEKKTGGGCPGPRVRPRLGGPGYCGAATVDFGAKYLLNNPSLRFLLKDHHKVR